ALLSIDPAKRMAAALGLKIGLDLTPLDFDLPGRVDATMLDTKAVFDGMVRRHAPDVQTAEKILKHSLYQAASTQLAGPAEYMALALIQDLIENPKYDHIVVDTPPDTQALEFLRRPNILSGFRDHKVMYWLVKPFAVASRFGVDRLFSVGEKLMGGLSKVTGFQALRMVSEFLVLMQQVIDGFQTAGEAITAILGDAKTAFVLVASGRADSVRSAKVLCQHLDEMGYKLEWLLLNKCIPEDIREALQYLKQQDLPQDAWKKDASLLVLQKRVDAEDRASQILRAEVQGLSSMGAGMLMLSESLEGLIGKQDFLQFSQQFEGVS
ncbi:MAG: hypothetical protein OXT67_04890, partial [Zetaproteobacteria bacterium]|nr:hypothetical protein [Zetaproteobacteria bacterium]